jgi:thymidylate kinase
MNRLKRTKDRIEQRPMSYHEQVHKNYLAQAAADPKRYKIINADHSIEEVQTEIWSAVSPFVE